MDRRSSPDLPQSVHHAGRITTFEETYPRYEFAELVRLTLALAAWLVRGRRRLEARRPPRVSRSPLSGGTTTPAE
jgi:hypothetical protein